ncbi:MAG: NUDIX hydrolase [Solirubrobacteraceae bacterium]
MAPSRTSSFVISDPQGYGKYAAWRDRYSGFAMQIADANEFRFCPLCGDELVPLLSGPDCGRPGCLRGHFVHYNNPAITAFAFIEQNGYYLVLRRGQQPYRGRWELPGGFVEVGESPDAAVRREIFEETGLCVEATSIIGAYTSRYGDDGKWTVDVAFHCHAPSGELNLSAESSDAAWVSIEQMPPLAFAGEQSAFEEFKQGLASA